MEKNRNLLVLTSLIVIALLFKYSGFLGSLFEPLDDYAIYDDFSDINYPATSSLETIQIDTCLTNTCGGTFDHTDGYGCDVWKTMSLSSCTPKSDSTIASCCSNCCFRTSDTPLSTEPPCYGYGAGCKTCGCIITYCNKHYNTVTYCGGSSGGIVTPTKTINLPENVKLVIAHVSLPDLNLYTFTINGNPISVKKFNNGYDTYNPSVILFKLSDYPNSKMNFGSNTIQTDFPITVYVQTGFCENYIYSGFAPYIYSPEGVNIMPKMQDGAKIERHQQCYYPKWEGRKLEVFWFQPQYQSTQYVVVSPADFTPSLGKMNMYNDVSVKDFKNSDIKIKYYGEIKVDILSLKENIFYKGIENSVSLPTLAKTEQDHIVEILHSKITPGELHIYNDAIYIGNLTANFNNYHLRITNPRYTAIASNGYGYVYGVGNTDYVKYKLPFNCEIFGDEKLVSETYSTGETLYREDDDTLIYNGCKALKFCLGDRALITSSTGTMGDYEGEIYQVLSRGDSLTVPAGETWQLFFITKKAETGRCLDYSRKPDTFEPVSISTVTSPLTIYPGKFKIFETEHIDITSMPSVLKATFLIKAVAGGLEQTKDEVIVFRR